MSRALMICGTASDVGKSQLVTGLCRAFARRGLRVAPFKGQNMALNSVVTAIGAEIGRAQGTQALAAGIEPEAIMNPVLLKPTSDRTSQVIVRGQVWRTLDALAYHEAKAQLVPVVDEALAELRSRFDLVLCEGAGSPAEINLFDHDLVNLGLASRAGIPAVVVGDIDRGGVFAHLYGTLALLPEERRIAVRGFVINKFRGDPALLGDAAVQLEERCGVPLLGVLPYLEDLWLDAEDSMALIPFQRHWGTATSAMSGQITLDVAVIRFPRISNFTDFDPLLCEPCIAVRYVDHPARLGDPDLVILPGTKSTVNDLRWFKESGLVDAVARARGRRATILGICGGYQMLGGRILDPKGVESEYPESEGLGWLPVTTEFEEEKVTARRVGLSPPDGLRITGYEIHHGHPRPQLGARPWLEFEGDVAEGMADPDAGVFGSSLHGLFEEDDFRSAFMTGVSERRQIVWAPSGTVFGSIRDAQIERLADVCEQRLDLERVLALAAPVSETVRP